MNITRGVNLGGWLVLERWMTPELFNGYDALDEYHLLEALGEKRHDVIKHHRDTFITKDDFKWIKDHGIDTVRIPIGYWLFNAEYPYIKAKSYVDQAFDWADEVGLFIVLDLHAAPGCQNGFDNGGLSGICEWHKRNGHIDQTLAFLKQLAQTYKHQSSLKGIEVLNEPRWDISLKIIQDFYKTSYTIIRDTIPRLIDIYFHDGFRLNEWESFFKENAFENVYLDTHMYQVFSDNDATRKPHEVIEKVAIKRHNELQHVLPYVNVIIGEWSLGIHPNTLDQLSNNVTKTALYKAVANSLLLTFEQTSGWFFWNYKLSPESLDKHPGWSLKEAIKKQYLELI